MYTLGLTPKAPMKAVFDHFGLDQNTVDFIGHALCLYRDDRYVLHLYHLCIFHFVVYYFSFIQEPCIGTINRAKLYG